MFDGMFASPAVVAETDDRAWLRAMLDAEVGLARAGARAGLVPQEALEAIEQAATPDRFDAAGIFRRAADSATPVVPLLADLRAALPQELRGYLHLGATSQDIVDSALGLVASRAMAPILDSLGGATEQLARLAQAHRDTVHIGRTLLQRAEPTTFGAVCAGWLTAIAQARSSLRGVREHRLAVQLGGPVGTLARYGDQAPEMLRRYAAELGLAEPVLPWHTDRSRVAELAAALGIAAGALGTVALDVVLLSQHEVGEVAEGSPGGSSAMPHKRNPARSVLITAAVHRVPGLVGTVLAGMPQEYQRAAGRWQAEWATVSELLRLTGGAAGHAAALLTELRVYPDRMRANAGPPAPGETGAAGLFVDRALAAYRAPTESGAT